jgi:hypothetical protein
VVLGAGAVRVMEAGEQERDCDEEMEVLLLSRLL